MTRDPSTVEASATVEEAAQLMDKEDIGNVLVVENGEVQGIVTRSASSRSATSRRRRTRTRRWRTSQRRRRTTNGPRRTM
jgi:CBS domain-containing protein